MKRCPASSCRRLAVPPRRSRPRSCRLCRSDFTGEMPVSCDAPLEVRTRRSWMSETGELLDQVGGTQVDETQVDEIQPLRIRVTTAQPYDVVVGRYLRAELLEVLGSGAVAIVHQPTMVESAESLRTV